MTRIEDLFDDNRHMLEKSMFGVCQFVGDRLGISPARIRMYFIYLSFVTFGSPLIVYLFLAFWINVRKYIVEGTSRFLSE